MAVTKTNSSITQVTATGNSTDIDISNAYAATAHIEHNNGTGTITVAAQIDVRVSSDGGTTWYVLATLVADTTASSQQWWVVDLPPGSDTVDLDYTAPTGSTGHTLDMDVGEITAI